MTGSSIVHADGNVTELQKESWYMPGVPAPVVFSEAMLQGVFESMTLMLTEVVIAAREFAENIAAGVPKTSPDHIA